MNPLCAKADAIRPKISRLGCLKPLPGIPSHPSFLRLLHPSETSESVGNGFWAPRTAWTLSMETQAQHRVLRPPALTASNTEWIRRRRSAISPNSAQFRSTTDQVWPIPSQSRPRSAEILSTSHAFVPKIPRSRAEFVRYWPGVDRTWPDGNRVGAQMARCRRGIGPSIGPVPTAAGQTSTGFAEFPPGIQPMSAELGPISAKIGARRPHRGHPDRRSEVTSRTRVGQCMARALKLCRIWRLFLHESLWGGVVPEKFRLCCPCSGQLRNLSL